MTNIRFFVRSVTLSTAALWCLLATAPAAHATPETLKRAVANVLCAPFDVALSPVSATYSVVDNMRNIEDSDGVRFAYMFPGVAWNTGMVVGIGVIRGITGVLELLPGLGLLFSESDIDPLFAPVENSEALVEFDTPVLWIRFGMLYMA